MNVQRRAIVNLSQAIKKYYEAGYVWLDECTHDYDDTLIEIPNSVEDIYMFQALYKGIIEPVKQQVEAEDTSHFVGFERGETTDSVRLYFGYPVSDCMESRDGTQAIADHLRYLNRVEP